ncbi:exosome complex RNA-binding protein Csl4 [Methanococcoides sp.]|uniref:exosome complex RNA-binding protein Csl4 n=1 Tax=Methanococcoides sp. TaxID=1966350 RepID=UPI00272E81EA|nr:exosome complex RNA-binding protein Csl4 [Methanococcoides sp.]
MKSLGEKPEVEEEVLDTASKKVKVAEKKVEKRKTETPKTNTEDDHVEEEQHGEKVLVMPGDIIGTTEEFEAGDNTYIVRGDILSLATGFVMVNKKRRTISVKPTTSMPPTIKKGDILIGTVVNVRDSMALVQIEGIKGVVDRQFIKPGVAAIHVSNVKESYVKEMSKEFAVADVVKAKVINIENMRMTTSGKELGVMVATCANCGSTLKKDDQVLKCAQCGRTESRKISSDYGTGII